jgi:glycosyltransferase involved in cell wall biosynthesis
MRIAFLHHPNDPYTQVRIKYFVSAGHKVWSIVFANKPPQKPMDGVEIITLPEKQLARIPFGRRLVYGREISRISSELKLDVLYIISALNSYYLKCSNAKRTYLEAQGSDVITSPDKYLFLRFFYRRFWPYADGITQDSELARKNVFKYLPKGIKNQTIEIGIDFNLFNPQVSKGVVRDKFGLGTRPIVFHSRGIKPLYNLETIIKAAAIVKDHLPDVCFVFCGDEKNLSEEGKRLIEEGNVRKNVLFVGWVDHDTEMPYFNADADLLVSVPLTDSSPFSVYEAMATHTPVIVSDLPWVESKFELGKHLFAVPALDAVKLAHTILAQLGNDPQCVQSAYDKVYEEINMVSENRKLEMFVSA